MSHLISLQNSGLSVVDKDAAKKVEEQIKEKELRLKRLQEDKKRHKERRDKLKEDISTVSQSNKEVAEAFKSFNREKVGKPRVEVDPCSGDLVTSLIGVRLKVVSCGAPALKEDGCVPGF